MNLLYYYVEKNRYTIKNITTNHEFPPKNLGKHTHTFKLWFSFQKKKIENKNQVFNLTSNYRA